MSERMLAHTDQSFPISNFKELDVTKAIHARLHREDYLEKIHRETVAYRIAEIMSMAGSLVESTLPRLMSVSQAPAYSMEEDLQGLVRTFVNLRDLLCDFEGVYLEAIGQDPTAERAGLIVTEEELQSEIEDFEELDEVEA